MNDGKCDAAGRFWAGSLSDSSRPAPARYGASTPTSVLTHARRVDSVERLGWSPSGETFYYIDSADAAVTRSTSMSTAAP